MSKGHLVDQNVHKIPGFGAKNLMMAPVFPILSFQGTLVLGDKNPKHKSWRTSFLHDVFLSYRLAGSPD